MPPVEDRRAAVLGEFGGLGLPLTGHLWQAEGNWGYRNFDDTGVYEARYAELIKTLYPLVDKGLAAAVYTQTSDCEVEVNGLMTYDRAVAQARTGPVRQSQPGLHCRRSFVDRPDACSSAPYFMVELAVRPGATIRYTLDGSEPRPRVGPLRQADRDHRRDDRQSAAPTGRTERFRAWSRAGRSSGRNRWRPLRSCRGSAAAWPTNISRAMFD